VARFERLRQIEKNVGKKKRKLNLQKIIVDKVNYKLTSMTKDAFMK